MQDAHNAGRKGHLSLIARIMVATVAILWVLRGLDWHTLAAVFRKLSPWYFGLSLVIYAMAQVIMAVRWWLRLCVSDLFGFWRHCLAGWFTCSEPTCPSGRFLLTAKSVQIRLSA